MKKQTFLYILLPFGIMLIAIGSWWYLQSSQLTEVAPQKPINLMPKDDFAHSSTTQQVVLDDMATPTTTLAKTEFHWPIGTAQLYDYQSQVNMKVDMGMTLQTDSAWQTVNSKLSGILNMRIFDHKHDRIRLGFQLSSINLTMNEQVFPRFTALFETFFLVEMSKQGQPLYFHFPNYVSVANQKFIQEIINNIQVVLPTEPKQTWKAQEMHNTGYYQAQYQYQPTNEVHKHKTHYLNITLQNMDNNQKNFALSLKDKIHQSDFTAHIASQKAWLQTLKGQEKIDINMPTGKLASLVSKLQLNISNKPKNPHLAIWQAPDNYDRVLKQFAEAKGDPMLSQDVIKQTEIDTWRQHYASTDLTHLVNSIFERFPTADSINATDILPYVEELERYLTAYPDQALAIPTLLDTLNPSSKLSAYLIGTLENIGTPQAQQALSTIATNPKPEEAVQSRAVQAIMSFNFIEKPEPLVADTLWQLADSDNDERADTALLAVGSLVGIVQSGDSKQYYKVRDALSQRLQQSTPINQPTLLKAIGNSGDVSFLPEVEPYLMAEESDVRAAAVEAIRKFEDPLVLDYLINAITTDSHSDIRYTALKALQQREDQSQAISALKDYLPKETEYKLRRDLIRFLGKHKHEDSSIMEVLQQQLAEEKDRGMKKILYSEIYRR